MPQGINHATVNSVSAVFTKGKARGSPLFLLPFLLYSLVSEKEQKCKYDSQESQMKILCMAV